MNFFTDCKIKFVYSAADDVIWVSADSTIGSKKPKGLYSLSPQSNTWVKNSNSYSLENFNSISTDANGDLLVGGVTTTTDSYGLLIKKKGKLIFSKVDGFQNKTVWQIYRDPQNKLWVVSTSNNIYCQNSPGSEWIAKSITEISSQITQIFENSFGQFYALANFYLWEKKGSGWHWIKDTLPNNDYVIQEIIEGPNHNLWLGTYASGVIVASHNNIQNITCVQQFKDQNIAFLYLDKQKNIWVCSSKQTMVESEKQTEYYLSELPIGQPFTSNKYEQFQEFNLNSVSVSAMMVDDHGNYWVGAHDSIWNGYWNTDQGYYIKYQSNSGICNIDPKKKYDEIFAANFQIILSDKRVTDYKINGVDHKYIYQSNKPTTIEFSASPNGPIYENQKINFEINYSSASQNKISQSYFIKTNFTALDDGSTSQFADIFEFENGLKKSVHVKYKPDKSGKTQILVYSIDFPSFEGESFTNLVLVNMNDLRINYRDSYYKEISFQSGSPKIIGTYWFTNFATTSPQIPPARQNGIYEFHILDLVGNQVVFFLQVGGTKINPNFIVLGHAPIWFFTSAKGVIVFIFMIIMLIISANIAFLFFSHRKKEKQLRKKVVSKPTELVNCEKTAIGNKKEQLL